MPGWEADQVARAPVETVLLSSPVMDVFVIPIARDRYELYCETAAAVDDPSDTAAEGAAGGRIRRWIATARAQFSIMMAAAEGRQRGEMDEAPRGWSGRLQDRMLAWVAERVAEQRLLWNLRGQTEAVLAHPQDMPFDEVLALVRRTLQHDYERHRRWLVIDTLLLVISGALAIVPGPNILAYYFLFRVVGHWLSMRGARQGLDHVAFTSRPCPPLAELREVVELDPSVREARIHDISVRLRLQHLTTFFERMAAVPSRAGL